MMRLAAAIEAARRAQPVRITGRVSAVRGLTVLVRDLPSPVGSLVQIGTGHGHVPGEIVGFDDEHAIVMPLEATVGVRPGDAATTVRVQRVAMVGAGLLGRVIDAMGHPIDGGGPAEGLVARPLSPPPTPALRRPPISEALRTGVRAIDLMTPVGVGQRLGIFAGPGVGKSTLLGSIARSSSADVNVIALIGERGREVREFVEGVLGPEGLARSVIVVATGDESPLRRVRAALAATAMAEHFRDLGRRVLLMMDSITRFAHAQRQIGLSAGEPPATKGYTPSVFSALPLLLERAGILEAQGAGPAGSITGLYTILVEGDDLTEPVADAVRGILDGHVVLSRRLAQRSHFPAIDVLDSVSRVADEVTDGAHQAARRQTARLLALAREVEELVQIGAYARGSSTETDVAIEMRGAIDELLRQGAREREPFDASRSRLLALAVRAGDEIARRKSGGRP